VDEKLKVLELDLRDEALSMSSVGPRRYVHGAYRSEKVDHIIDPRTGEARAEVLSVTAVAPRAEAADALTTALIVLGEQEAPTVARAFGARTVVFVRPHDDGVTARTLDVKQGTWAELRA
jgi:thiamine biosynthesis lipoprotein ApbE